MEKNKVLLIVVALLSFIAIVFYIVLTLNKYNAQKTNTVDEIAKTYDAPANFEGSSYKIDDKFSFTYPKNWTIKETLGTMDDEVVTAEGPYGLIENEWEIKNYAPILDVNSTKTPDKGTRLVFQIIVANPDYDRAALTGCDELGSQCGTTNINGVDFIKSYFPNDNELTMKYIANKDNYIYYVRASIYGDDPTDPEYIQKSLQLVEEVSATFKILK